ncbi:hypothetical protein LR48_Vigan07g077200 [Vigna angularis]|uniref:Uncharacterized protein n=1 Tax=Phaseolus angularis TaxID=3914 RepID=A0A0L9UWD3_PHAAN|nr:hypothetical protein LR48_Vigan07g077200 [Vigna angularis]
MLWTTTLTKSTCILIFFLTAAFAATDMVVGNHRRILQYTDNANDENNHFHISDIFKKPDIIVYVTIGLLFLTFIGLSLCRYLRSKKDAPAPRPRSRSQQ